MFGLIFPFSNYTYTLHRLKEIGFWDTNAEAIGEDYHTYFKAFWKTKGNLCGVQTGVPFIQMSLSTGNGYIKDMIARFWQAERHARGIQDVAYNIKMLFEDHFCLRGLLMTF